MILERYAFVALTTTDLRLARRFWVDQLGFRVAEERRDDFFIVDAGGLRLCIDQPDGDIHVAGSTDPVIGFKVASLDAALAALADRGVEGIGQPTRGARGRYAILRDPDGRPVILTEVD